MRDFGRPLRRSGPLAALGLALALTGCGALRTDRATLRALWSDIDGRVVSLDASRHRCRRASGIGVRVLEPGVSTLADQVLQV